mmetsp:Transcript_7581/g.27808  ORF Transcript_7581/g.27808 Transcript_7581/m.27808 type:complete len:346 (+) Transcript_7581:403-1440(+)
MGYGVLCSRRHRHRLAKSALAVWVASDAEAVAHEAEAPRKLGNQHSIRIHQPHAVRPILHLAVNLQELSRPERRLLLVDFSIRVTAVGAQHPSCQAHCNTTSVVQLDPLAVVVVDRLVDHHRPTGNGLERTSELATPYPFLVLHVVIMSVDVRRHTIFPQQRIEQSHQGRLVSMVSVGADRVVPHHHKPRHTSIAGSNQALLQKVQLPPQLNLPRGGVGGRGPQLALLGEWVLTRVPGLRTGLIQVLLRERSGVQKHDLNQRPVHRREQQGALKVGVPSGVALPECRIKMARNVGAVVLVVSHDAMPRDIQRRETIAVVDVHKGPTEVVVTHRGEAVRVKGIADI